MESIVIGRSFLTIIVFSCRQPCVDEDSHPLEVCNSWCRDIDHLQLSFDLVCRLLCSPVRRIRAFGFGRRDQV